MSEPLDPQLLVEARNLVAGGYPGLPFNERQLWYQFRKVLAQHSKTDLDWKSFKVGLRAFIRRYGAVPGLSPPPQASRDSRGMPYHCAVVYLPGQPPQETARTYPIGKVKGKYYCKYCYQTHRDWWQMDPKDYSLGEEEPVDVILCGKCTHTSRKEFAQG